MPERTVIEQLMQNMGAAMAPVLLALFGGLVRVLRGPGPCSLRFVVASLAASAFTGYLVHEGLLAFPTLPDGIRTMCVGVGGYSGGRLLDIMTARLCGFVANGRPPLGR